MHVNLWFLELGYLDAAQQGGGWKKNEECREEMNYCSVKYNEGLMSMLQELKSELKETYYSFSDSYKVFLDLIQRPAAYGTTDYFLFIN